MKSSFNQIFQINNLSNLILYQIDNNPAILLKGELEKIINFIGDNSINEISSGIIYYVYDYFTNIINNQMKILTSNDILLNNKFLKNINNMNNISDFIKENNIFEISKKLTSDIIDKSSQIISQISNIKMNTEILGFNLSLTIDDGKLNISSTPKCFTLNVIEEFAKDIFPLIIPVPSFPFLQLRITPDAILHLCTKFEFTHEFNYSSTNLTLDFNCEAQAFIKVEGGIFLDAYLTELNFAIVFKGKDKNKFFEGKVGIRFSIDFMQIKINLAFYFELKEFSFTICIELYGRFLLWDDNKEIPIYSYKTDEYPYCLFFDFYLYENEYDELELEFDGDFMSKTKEISSFQ